MKESGSKNNKLFIVHWKYDKYGIGYGASYDHIDIKELFEFENEANLKEYLDYILTERKLEQHSIKSVKLITRTRQIKIYNQT